MANDRKAYEDGCLWYITYDILNNNLRSAFKLEYPATLIDNSTSLSNINSFTTDSYSTIIDYISTNNLNLNNKIIEE